MGYLSILQLNVESQSRKDTIGLNMGSLEKSLLKGNSLKK